MRIRHSMAAEREGRAPPNLTIYTNVCVTFKSCMQNEWRAERIGQTRTTHSVEGRVWLASIRTAFTHPARCGACVQWPHTHTHTHAGTNKLHRCTYICLCACPGSNSQVEIGTAATFGGSTGFIYVYLSSLYSPQYIYAGVAGVAGRTVAQAARRTASQQAAVHLNGNAISLRVRCRALSLLC